MVVGLSGGIDSVVLLHALARAQTNQSDTFSCSALHVNHGLSPHAQAWERFCIRYCEKLGVLLKCVQVAVERSSRDGLEAAARRARDNAFRNTEAEWLVLGHHRDDQAETLIFNLLRGAGVQGAAAMRMRNQRKLRPLLAVSRTEIRHYADEHQLEWIDDESNAEIRHSRNYLRHQVMPVLRKRFPAAVKNLSAAAERFAEAEELIDALAIHDLGSVCNNFPLPVKVLQPLGEKRARNVLRYLLKINGVMIPSELRLREALRQMLDAAQDRHPSVRLGQLCLRRIKGSIYLEPLTG